VLPTCFGRPVLNRDELLEEEDQQAAVLCLTVPWLQAPTPPS